MTIRSEGPGLSPGIPAPLPASSYSKSVQAPPWVSRRVKWRLALTRRSSCFIADAARVAAVFSLSWR